MNPPPLQAFDALFPNYPPGIPVVSTTGISPVGPVTVFAKQAVVPKPPALMPPHLLTGGKPFADATVAAKAAAIASAHAHGNQNMQNIAKNNIRPC